MIKTPSKQAIEAALRNPNGYIYEIDSKFNDHDPVPPEGLIGAWQVNSQGQIIGDFIPNTDYKGGSK